MARGIDHIVHAVRDLDAAAARYEALGFTVGVRNKHPWGTHNRIIQFDGNYIELLTVAEPEKITPHAPRSFSFGAFHRDFLARQQGIAMILLNTPNAEADSAAWRGAGIGDYEVFTFEREGKRPDGVGVKLAFSLIFATDTNAPQAGFGACQHHYPENFWSPAFQQHANGVRRIAGVVTVADEAARHRDFLLSYTGARETRDTADGFTIALPRGTVEVTTPTGFERSFAVAAPHTSHGARLAALRFAGGRSPGKHETLGALLLFEPAG